MKKKLVSLLLVLSLVLGSFSMVFAAPADVVGTDYEEDVAKLMAIGVLAGYPDGTFKPENTVTRAEFAKMIVVASGLEDAAVLSAGVTQFPDVTADHWAAGYINVATQKKFIEGYPNGNYGAEDDITYAQMFTILIRAIGLGDVVEKDGVWPSNYLAKAVQLELNDGLSSAANDAATRGDVAIAFVNTITETIWEAGSVNSDGTVDYGPSIAGNTMLTELGYDTIASISGGTANVITSTQQYGGEKADEFVAAIDKTGAAGATTYTLADSCMQDPDAFYGQEVTLWLDGDKDVLYIENETDADDIVVDYYDTYTAAAAPAPANLELDNEDDYDFVAATGYVNGAVVAVGALPATYADKTEVKLVLDGNGDIAYYAIWNEIDNNGNVETDIVDAVGDDIEFLNAEIADITIADMNDDIDDDKVRVEVVRNGEVASIEDIEEGDVVTLYDNGGKYVKYVVTDDKVNGTLSKVKAEKVYIGTEAYSVDTDALASPDNGDSFPLWTAAATTQSDFVGENVKLYLNSMGEVAYILSDVSEVAENYAIVTEVISNVDVAAPGATGPLTWSVVSGVSEAYIEVLSAEDETVVLSFENTATSKAAYAAAANLGADGFMKYELNSDGYVEDVYVAGLISATNYASIPLATTNTDDSPAYVEDTVGSAYFITGDTVVFVTDSTTPDDAKVYENWDDVNASIASQVGAIEVVFSDDMKAEYVAIDMVVGTDAMYAMFVAEGVDVDGETLDVYKDGTDYTISDTTGTIGTGTFAEGDFVSYRVSSDDYVVDTSNVIVDGTGAAAVPVLGNGILFNHDDIKNSGAAYTFAATYKISSVDTVNSLLTVENVATTATKTYALESDVLIYNLDDKSAPEMLTIDDLTNKFYVRAIDTDPATDNEIEILVLDK